MQTTNFISKKASFIKSEKVKFIDFFTQCEKVKFSIISQIVKK